MIELHQPVESEDEEEPIDIFARVDEFKVPEQFLIFKKILDSAPF